MQVYLEHKILKSYKSSYEDNIKKEREINMNRKRDLFYKLEHNILQIDNFNGNHVLIED